METSWTNSGRKKQDGFDNAKYLQQQSQHIRDRVAQFGDKLYLEFGGKLFDDHHASRVLPGFKPDSKLQMLLQLKDEAEIVLVVSAVHIEKSKVRGDLGIGYDADALRLHALLTRVGLLVQSVVLTQFDNQPLAVAFQKRVEALGLRVYHHYAIPGYPDNAALIISEQGFGKNDFIETSRKIVVVTAPGPGSGKMATCLSQMYHEQKRGVKAGYAKFETFPVWNLSIDHPVNLAYEAATADLDDVNMIDPFHLKANGVEAVNYNRDVETYPLLNTMFEKILGHSPYESPTAMGVNMVGKCIFDEDVVCYEARQEILRRYYTALVAQKKGANNAREVAKLKLLLDKAGVQPSDRTVIAAAHTRQEETGGPASAMQLRDGTIITGRTSDLLGPLSGMLLNALKYLAGVPEKRHLMSPEVIEPIETLKIDHFGAINPRLHSDETLIALSICANTDPAAKQAFEKLDELRGCDAHCTVIVSQVDERTFKRLGINITCDPKFF